MSKDLRLRIVSDGPRPRDYRVLDADTGEEYINIRRITLEVDADEFCATATIELLDVEVDVQALKSEGR